MSIATALVRGQSAKTELIHEAVQTALDKAGLSYANAVLLFLSPHFARNTEPALHEAARIAACLQIDACIGSGLFTEDEACLGGPAAAAMVFGGDIQLRRAREDDSPVFSLAAPNGLDLGWLESETAQRQHVAELARDPVWQSLGGVPDEHIHAMTHRNTMRHFRYDPFEHIPKEQATVGALRAKAKHVDIRPMAGKGGKKPSDYASGYCTIDDIMKQMAGAYAVPFRDGQGVDQEAARRAMLELFARAQAGQR